MLRLLDERITAIGNRIPALTRSIEELKLIGVYYERNTTNYRPRNCKTDDEDRSWRLSGDGVGRFGVAFLRSICWNVIFALLRLRRLRQVS